VTLAVSKPASLEQKAEGNQSGDEQIVHFSTFDQLVTFLNPVRDRPHERYRDSSRWSRRSAVLTLCAATSLWCVPLSGSRVLGCLGDGYSPIPSCLESPAQSDILQSDRSCSPDVPRKYPRLESADSPRSHTSLAMPLDPDSPAAHSILDSPPSLPQFAPSVDCAAHLPNPLSLILLLPNEIDRSRTRHILCTLGQATHTRSSWKTHDPSSIATLTSSNTFLSKSCCFVKSNR